MKKQQILGVLLIVALMCLLVIIGIVITLAVAYDATEGNKGLTSITAFLLGTIAFGSAMNKVINKIKRLWNIS